MDLTWKAFTWRLWEDNRRLTLRAARAFPGDALMTYTPVASLRPFGTMLDEIARLEIAYVRGLAEDVWVYPADDPLPAQDAAGTIGLLEQVRAYSTSVWPGIHHERLSTTRDDPFWGGPPDAPVMWLQRALENEVHHRGQGFVYLRHLGLRPPEFFDRS